MRQTLKVQIAEDKYYPIEISDSSFDKLKQEIASYTANKKKLIIL